MMKKWKHNTSSISWLIAAVQTLENAGIDGKKRLFNSGIDLEKYRGDERRAPVEVIGNAWRLVAQELDDPAIGLRAAKANFNAAHWQSLGLAFLCSSTLRSALERLVRFFEVLSDAADTKLEHRNDMLCFVAHTRQDPELIGYEAMEFGIGGLLVLMQEIFPRPLHPVEVRLLRPSSSASKDFEKLLGCPVVFDSPYESIAFDILLVDEPLPSSNQRLAHYEDSFSEDYVTRFGNNSIAIEVKNQILRLLPGGESSISKIADVMHSSTRNLQRKLHAENTSFNALLSDIRKQLALAYITKSHHSLTEIAYLLGFADHSSFSRAFKLWFNETPTDYRKRIELLEGEDVDSKVELTWQFQSGSSANII